MEDWILWIIFIVLVILPFLCEIKYIKQRFIDVWDGIEGLKYAPLSFGVLISTALLFVYLSEFIPILQWGLWGFNIATFGVLESEGTNIFFIIGMVVFLFFLMLVFNYCEEDKSFRKTNKGVVVWALLHIIMGIPLYAVFPIFFAGLVFRQVFIRKGKHEAYVTHLFTNTFLLIILLIGMILTL